MSTCHMRCGNALWLGSEGMYDSFYLWIKRVGGR